MTETEYMNSTDLAKLRTVQAILRDCNCMEDPNKTRLKGMEENCKLMVQNLYDSVTIEVED